MVEVKIESIRVSLMTTTQVIILKEINNERYLPIFMAKPEGDAITLHLREEVPSRPMTHDLVISMMDGLDGQIIRVVISEMRNNHFFAQLVLKVDNKESLLDVRSSDAIALAVRVACPIFVDEDVMAQVGVVQDEDDEDSAIPDAATFGAFGDFLDSLNLDLDDQSNEQGNDPDSAGKEDQPPQ